MVDLRILNDYFDKIYVITLHRAIDRQEKVNQHFANVDFDFFYGTDKLNLEMDELIKNNLYDPKKAKQFHRNNKEMAIGMIACSMSHRELYKEILKEGYEKVLIMEDDFVPADISTDLISQILNELPPDWELLYWGYYLNERPTIQMQLKKVFIYF